MNARCHGGTETWWMWFHVALKSYIFLFGYMDLYMAVIIVCANFAQSRVRAMARNQMPWPNGRSWTVSGHLDMAMLRPQNTL